MFPLLCLFPRGDAPRVDPIIFPCPQSSHAPFVDSLFFPPSFNVEEFLVENPSPNRLSFPGFDPSIRIMFVAATRLLIGLIYSLSSAVIHFLEYSSFSVPVLSIGPKLQLPPFGVPFCEHFAFPSFFFCVSQTYNLVHISPTNCILPASALLRRPIFFSDSFEVYECFRRVGLL